jgi:hypothetical protein
MPFHFGLGVLNPRILGGHPNNQSMTLCIGGFEFGQMDVYFYVDALTAEVYAIGALPGAALRRVTGRLAGPHW